MILCLKPHKFQPARAGACLAPVFLLAALSVASVSAQDVISDDVALASATQQEVSAVDLADFRTRALQAGWSESDVAQIVTLARALARDGLPYQPVLDRARQGLAKGARVNRVRVVCDGLNDRIRAGAALVDAAFPAAARVRSHSGEPVFKERLELVDRAAFAIEKGVPPASLNAIFQRTRVSGSPAAQINAMDAPVLALTSLTAEGVPADEGVEFVSHVSAKGVRGKDLEDLGIAVGEAMRGGRSAEVLALVIDSLDRGIPPGQVIRELHGWRAQGGGHPGLGPGAGQGERGFGRPGDNGPAADPGRRGRGHGGRRRN